MRLESDSRRNDGYCQEIIAGEYRCVRSQKMNQQQEAMAPTQKTSKKRLPKGHLRVMPHTGSMRRAIALAPEIAEMTRQEYPDLSMYHLWRLFEDCCYLKREIEQRYGGFLLGEYRTVFLMELTRCYYHPADKKTQE
jgi:hypothetical protein